MSGDTSFLNNWIQYSVSSTPSLKLKLVQLEVVNRIGKSDKSKVRCGADQ
ncbi:hypothetical protein Syun_029570 [Stephania yunnanensis]|uniref:Uncharacterized protein n=1 Tax=Stephania yunnanensis TaxID=152371 RepID=A0AAP0E5V2_9MAGN